MIEWKLQEFMNKWLWKRIDVDNAYGYQCTDLSKKRAMELGIKPWTFNGAAKNADKNTFPWMKLMLPWPWNDLKPWDILQQQATATNPYWHTGVVVRNTVDGYILLEQNWATWKWTWLWQDAIRTKRYTRKNRQIVNFFRFQ